MLTASGSVKSNSPYAKSVRKTLLASLVAFHPLLRWIGRAAEWARTHVRECIWDYYKKRNKPYVGLGPRDAP